MSGTMYLMLSTQSSQSHSRIGIRKCCVPTPSQSEPTQRTGHGKSQRTVSLIEISPRECKRTCVPG
jgi:hypothetical protein